MQYILKLPNDKKAIMDIVGSMPTLPEGFELLGKAEDLPEAIAEIAADRQAELDTQIARQFLSESDWKVMRHRDQIDAGVPTSLTVEEFTQLLADRQAARDLI